MKKIAIRSKRVRWVIQALIVIGGLALFAALYHYKFNNMVKAQGGTEMPDLVSGLKK